MMNKVDENIYNIVWMKIFLMVLTFWAPWESVIILYHMIYFSSLN